MEIAQKTVVSETAAGIVIKDNSEKPRE